jgi:hypothetical protein
LIKFEECIKCEKVQKSEKKGYQEYRHSLKKKSLEPSKSQVPSSGVQ